MIFPGPGIFPLVRPAKPAAGGGGASYSATVIADAPYLYWRLGDASGTTAADSSGNSRQGTYNNGDGSFTLGQSGLLTGDSDKAIRLQSAYALSNVTLNTRSATLELVVKIASYAAFNSHLCGFSQGNSSGTYEKSVYIDASGGVHFYVVDIYTAGGPFVVRAVSTGALALNTKYHVACTIGAGGHKIYVNGTDLTAADTGARASYDAYGGNNILLGGRTAEFGYLPDFIADEFAVYNFQLSAARIGAHAAAA